MLGQKKADDVGSNVTVAAIHYWKKIKKTSASILKTKLKKNYLAYKKLRAQNLKQHNFHQRLQIQNIIQYIFTTKILIK